MKKKMLISVLNLVTLVVACLFGVSIYNYKCFRCSETFGYFQFINGNAYGLLLLIFFVCVSILAKEEIPRKMELSISFLSAILYFCVACTVLFLFFNSYDSLRVLLAVVTSFALVALHLCVGIMLTIGQEK